MNTNSITSRGTNSKYSLVVLMFVLVLLILNGCQQILLEENTNLLNSPKPIIASTLETSFFKTNKLLGGDATIINAKLNSKNSQSQKVFTIDVATDGEYYLNAWAKPNGEITHGSIRKPGNNHVHGYDWESKPGSLARTFHPRDALSGIDYGSIVKYYKPVTSLRVATGAAQDISFEESVAHGLTTIESVKLTNNEKDIILSHKIALPNGTKTINTLYNIWMNKIKSDEYKIISNPYIFIETKEGQELLSYARNNIEEAVLFFSSIIFNTEKNKAFEQNISYYMFWQIAKKRYGTIMENIKDEWKNNKYSKDGKYIAPLPGMFTKKYIKHIINVI